MELCDVTYLADGSTMIDCPADAWDLLDLMLADYA